MGHLPITLKIKVTFNGQGNDARIVPFDSPFVLRLSKDERRLRTGFGNVCRLKKEVDVTIRR
jgi:hypothetical protein